MTPEELRKEVSEHAEIIKDTVFHSYPHNSIGFKSDAPHAEDCGGCIINAEVEKLVTKLNDLSDTVKIKAELAEVKMELEDHKLDRWRAFERANVIADGPVVDLVDTLIDQLNRFAHLVQTAGIDVDDIAERLRVEDKLTPIIDTVKISAELKEVKKERDELLIDKRLALNIAGVVGEGSITTLVSNIIDKRDSLVRLVHDVGVDINLIANKLKE